ncbi:hypothetical protein Aduo_004608 [Ancylostoma duodenale]
MMLRIRAVKFLLIGSVLATLLALYSYQEENLFYHPLLVGGHHQVHKKGHVGSLFKKLRKRFAKLQKVLDEHVKKQKLMRRLTHTSNSCILDKHEQPSYRPLRRLETAHVDCGRVLNGDKDYIASIAKNRPVLIHKNEERSCEMIRHSIVPPTQMKKMMFGVAFARVVYRDYELIEDELRSSYHPQNFFCYSIDEKADKEFHSSMKKLASCFPNVIISPDEYNLDEAGHFMNHAHYSCMKLLVQKQGWEYILLLQNHDVIIKSPYEMVEIYKLLEGANDIEITPCPEDRLDQTRQWDARSLNLFRNESAVTPKQLNAHLTFAKGAAQASLSRPAVEWLVNTADLTTLMNQLNEKQFGVDEILMESLQVSDDLDMPGRFTSECLMRGLNTPFISRMSIWEYDDAYRCRSKYSRKSICILGIEDLQTLSQYPHLMANKMLPEFDYSIVECVHEMIFNRTFHDQVDHALDSSYYSNMVNVKFNRNRKRLDPSYRLECA